MPYHSSGTALSIMFLIGIRHSLALIPSCSVPGPATTVSLATMGPVGAIALEQPESFESGWRFHYVNAPIWRMKACCGCVIRTSYRQWSPKCVYTR